jgi:hypothetical protein
MEIIRKRRQHHVWQRYLKSWTVDDKIYCLKDSAIFATNTSKVAVDRDFYNAAYADEGHKRAVS